MTILLYPKTYNAAQCKGRGVWFCFFFMVDTVLKAQKHEERIILLHKVQLTIQIKTGNIRKSLSFRLAKINPRSDMIEDLTEGLTWDWETLNLWSEVCQNLLQQTGASLPRAGEGRISVTFPCYSCAGTRREEDVHSLLHQSLLQLHWEPLPFCLWDQKNLLYCNSLKSESMTVQHTSIWGQKRTLLGPLSPLTCMRILHFKSWSLYCHK